MAASGKGGSRSVSGRGGSEGARLWPEVDSGDPAPVYGVFGEEDFLVTEVIDRFIASPAFAQNPSLNVERFLAGDTPPGRVLESAATLPFLGSRRLVIVNDFHLYKAARQAEFADYLAQPAPSTCLVLAGVKLDMRTKLAKSLKAGGKLHVFKKMYHRDLVPWLHRRAAARGNRLSPGAAERLAELAGLGLGALDSELEKLSLYVGDGEVIGEAEVKAVVGAGRLYSIFDFTDALTGRRLDRALTSLDQLISLGEPPVRILAMVVRLHRQLLQARAILDTGGGQSEVQRALRTPPAATRTLVERARRESPKRLTGRLRLVLAADVALKSSPVADHVIMERLVMDLCA